MYSTILPALSLEVLVNGKVVQKYLDQQGRTWVEGRKGSEYELRVINPSLGRCLAILSVDGLSVMDGKSAGDGSNGYVIDPGRSATIPGWRLDGEKVARFTFSSLGESYSIQGGGEATNVGVIGCRWIAEKIVAPVVTWNCTPTPHWWDIYKPTCSYSNGIRKRSIFRSSYNAEQTSAPQNSCCVDSQTFGREPVQEMGTAFGQATSFVTQDTHFSRGEIITTLSIFYDSRKGLERRGILQTPLTPNPFPASGCKPPPGWNAR